MQTSAAQVVQSVMTRHLGELRRQRDQASHVDMVELRLDALETIDVAAALEGRTRPVIVTCRPTWEGGHFAGSEEERERILREALTRGAELVDVEWRAGCAQALCRVAPDRLVLSRHDYRGVPADLTESTRQMRALGPRGVKLAVTPARLADLGALAQLYDPARRDRDVFIGMGTVGLPSRILAARFGSAWTYVGSEAIAPGQLTATQLLGEYRFRRIRPDTPVYGVVGRPIGHSLSPAMHNAAFEARALDAVYIPLEAADWGDVEQAASLLDLRGCSVTAPFKEPAFHAARVRDALAEDVGAVNTLKRVDGVWHGCNTDVAGFLAPLTGMDLQGCRASVLGAGGAARAVVRALASRGARVTVHARQPDRAARLADELPPCEAAATYVPAAGTWDLLVNTTPVGTYPDVDHCPIDLAALSGPMVYDLVYNPETTRLLREARERGAIIISGLSMLVAQAAAQFAWWTGLEADRESMRGAARRRLAAAQQPDGGDR